jgi:predicted RNA binding protein YcfA (HicA-like mRNA interferase family)
LRALLRIGWTVKRHRSSHRILTRPGWPDYVFAFHEGDEIGPRLLACIAKHTGCVRAICRRFFAVKFS